MSPKPGKAGAAGEVRTGSGDLRDGVASRALETSSVFIWGVYTEHPWATCAVAKGELPENVARSQNPNLYHYELTFIADFCVQHIMLLGRDFALA